MPKNFYNPRDIRSMTRNANQSSLDRLRYLEQEQKRRQREIEKAESAMQELSSMADELAAALGKNFLNGFAEVIKQSVSSDVMISGVDFASGADNPSKPPPPSEWKLLDL